MSIRKLKKKVKKWGHLTYKEYILHTSWFIRADKRKFRHVNYTKALYQQEKGNQPWQQH